MNPHIRDFKHELDLERIEDTQVAVDVLYTIVRYDPKESPCRNLMLRLSTNTQRFPAAFNLDGITLVSSEVYGTGSFGDVFQAKYFGRPVALKRLRTFRTTIASEEKSLRQGLLNEALVWQGLRHEFVLPFLGITDTVFSNMPCIVSPWMTKGTIRQVIDDMKSQRLPFLVRVPAWMHEISVGLSYLHDAGIVHGNLRGANILVSDDCHVQIADFGLAVYAECGSGAQGSLRGGNTRWLAPELIHPERFGMTSSRPTTASDVYSFACVGVELLTAKAPFSDMSDIQLVGRIPAGLKPPKPDFSDLEVLSTVLESLWAVIVPCWETSLVDRPEISVVSERLGDLPYESAGPITSTISG